jgi:hypothetical protein
MLARSLRHEEPASPPLPGLTAAFGAPPFASASEDPIWQRVLSRYRSAGSRYLDDALAPLEATDEAGRGHPGW